MNGSTALKANKLGDLSFCPLLANLPASELQRNCPTARVLSLRHRDTIYRQGGSNQAVFCVLRGQVTLARVNHDGAIVTTAALSAGDFFGDGLDGSLEAEDTAKAKGAALVWRVSLNEFQRCWRITRHSHLDISPCSQSVNARCKGGWKASLSKEPRCG